MMDKRVFDVESVGGTMPIKPENRSKYPAEWPQIRATILERAGGKCERCGVINHAEGARDLNGEWHDEHDIQVMNSDIGYSLFGEFPPIIRIVLTIAHLDHNPANNDPNNLQALCQLCHNRHDAAHRAETRKATLAARREQKHGKQLSLEGL
jgi:5-methylcytosine-specific restriction endonuclease McrA